MTDALPPHQRSDTRSTIGQDAEGAVPFLAEIAALEALDDADFADVLPSARPVIAVRVVARGGAQARRRHRSSEG